MCQSRLGHLHPFVVQARPLGSDTRLDLIEVFPHLFTLMRGAGVHLPLLSCCFYRSHGSSCLRAQLSSGTGWRGSTSKCDEQGEYNK